MTLPDSSGELLANLNRLHTTELGIVRIRKNLSLDERVDVVNWCRDKILSAGSKINREGKNWYITADNSRITVNAYSCTIITAHKLKDSIS